jgi:hypothetical protein
VKYLLEQPSICLNIRNNDRLTTFMLAMQVNLLPFSSELEREKAICLL